VGRFCADPELSAGTGFAFAIEEIRELLGAENRAAEPAAPWLVAASAEAGLGAALARLAELHAAGQAAELCPDACASAADAERIAASRGCRGAQWLAA
jgi:hypothetical protein